MGLLSRATTLDTAKALPGLAFSDFINNHSLKICALLEKENPNYNVTNCIGFDAHSILSASSTSDFWDGICPDQGKIYTFTDSKKNQLLQLFSFDLKDNLHEFAVYKSSQNKILLCAGKLTSDTVKDFEKVCNEEHKNNIERFNSLIKDGSVVLLYKLEFLDAAKAFFDSLTLCPIDKMPIVKELLLQEEIDWLNQYHQLVFDTLSPHLDDEESAWLKDACAAI